MKKTFLFLLTLVLVSILLSCDSNFFNVVPVKHEYDSIDDFIVGLSHIEFKNEVPSKFYFCIMELDSQFEYSYYIESITTTRNSEVSTPEYPKMSTRGFNIGITIYIEDVTHIIELREFSEESVQNIVIEDHDLSYFISNGASVDLLEMMVGHVESVELIEISNL
ncbi:hypothetical protein [Mariniplasma anaerobium]|uniref:Lipoprotein n=1 Tax=Mariniplasma anaerobium TaxID=2735436 RepID=A0A7U9XWT7_9MOLU|nr:hypothetical protein [Mariniplasma anaerobium]BCR36744.1 hypothetical protein MPAN_016370 [Mariniplasma anaerobium]